MDKKYKKQEKKMEQKFAIQRAKRGYADEDWWDIDQWFLRIMPKMLKKLRKYHQGTPIGIVDSANKVPGIQTLASSADGFTNSEDAWNAILDHMIFLLHEMDDEKCSQKNIYAKKIEKLNEEFHKQYGEEKEDGNCQTYKSALDVPENKKIFKKYFDREAEIMAYQDKCKDEFFSLFSEYFWNLWD